MNGSMGTSWQIGCCWFDDDDDDDVVVVDAVEVAKVSRKPPANKARKYAEPDASTSLWAFM